RTLLTSVFDTEVGGAGVTSNGELWKGIHVTKTGLLNMTHAVIRYASAAGVCSWGPPSLFIEGDANISYTTVEECGWMVLVFEGNRISITDSELLYTSENGFIAQAMGMRLVAQGAGGQFEFSNNEVEVSGFLANFGVSSGVENSFIVTMTGNTFYASQLFHGSFYGGITFTGNEVIGDSTGYSALQLSGLSGSVQIHNNSFYDYEAAIYMTGGGQFTEVSLTYNRFYGVDFEAFRFEADTIQSLIVEQNEFYGVWQSGAGNGAYAAIEVKSNLGSDVGLDMDSVIIRDNFFRTFQYAVKLEVGSCETIQVSDNDVGADFYAIYIEQSSDSKVDSVEIKGNTVYSDFAVLVLDFAGCEEISISNNQLTARDQDLIRISGDADRVAIRNNRMTRLDSYNCDFLTMRLWSNPDTIVSINFNIFRVESPLTWPLRLVEIDESISYVNAQYNFWGGPHAPRTNQYQWSGQDVGVNYVTPNVDYSNWIGQEFVMEYNFGGNGGNAALGLYSQSFSDLVVGTPGISVDFSRTYNSQDKRSTSFGTGWSFGFEGFCEDYKYTFVLEDGTTEEIIFDYLKGVRLPDGSTLSFTKVGDTYRSDNSSNTFVENADGSFT
ncbi:MAG: hypothetical protein GX099_05290, partial [Clostridiaceae bacterium]|nr:hypothetical protein [Clostridiaceae bacterium]